MKSLAIIAAAVVLTIGCSITAMAQSTTEPTPTPPGSGDGCGGACVDNATCYNGYCQCDYGFSGYGYQYCYDINECDYGYCSEYAYCINTIGSYECVCREGYTGDGYTCEDASCGNACVDYAICYNGSCQCDYGFTGDGYNNCTDINECYYYDDYCSENADCINTYGSFYCVCREGYTGSGYTCEAVGSGSGACGGNCVENAYCSYDGYCQCDYGFTGNGYEYCEDIDECENYEETCGYAECYNTYGSYECICDDGYYYSSAVTDCVPLEGVYRYRPIVLDGCYPERNAYYRDEIRYRLQQFLYDYSYRYGDYKK